MTTAIDVSDPVAGAAWLRAAAVSDDLIELVSPTAMDGGTGLLLPTLAGSPLAQLALSKALRTPGGPKYLSEPDRVAILCPVPRPDAPTVLVVEGTKGHLAAASHAAPEFEVWGILGCSNWSRDGVPLEELSAVRDRKVIICLDGDIQTNRNVNDAGEKLRNAVLTFGATQVQFLRLRDHGVGAKASMDDVLGAWTGDRAQRLAGLLAKTSPKSCDDKRRLTVPKGEGIERGPSDVEANDLDLAKAFADRHGETHNFDDHPASTGWYAFDGLRWRFDKTTVRTAAAFSDMVTREVRVIGERTLAGVTVPVVDTRYAHAARTKNAVLDYARSASPILVHGGWDERPHLFNTGNGTLDIETGEFRAGWPADRLTQFTPTAYDPHADCPRFDRFLSEVLPDEAVRDYVLGILAQGLTGRPLTDVLPVFHGKDGSNGKSTLIDAVAATIGDISGHGYYHAADRELIVQHKTPQHSTNLYALKGARLVTITETDPDVKLDIGKIKSLVSPDTQAARGMHMDQRDGAFKPTHALIVVTNPPLPIPVGAGNPLYRRVVNIPFSQNFEGREEKGIDVQLASEASGILNRLLSAYATFDWRAKPQAIIDSTRAQRDESNAWFSHLHARYEYSPSAGDEVIVSELFDEWSRDPERPQGRAGKPLAVRTVFACIQEWDARIGRDDSGRHTVLTHLRRVGVQANDRGSQANSTQTIDLDRSKIATSSPIQYRQDSQTGKNTVVEVLRQQDNVSEISDQYAEDRAIGSMPALAAQPGPVVIDIEGPDVTTRWDDRDEGYTHLVGLRTATGAVDTAAFPGGVRAGNAAAAAIVAQSPMVIGHNLISFDLPVLARQYPDAGIDVLAMTRDRRVIDTMVIDATLNPPVHDGRPGFVERAAQAYSLNASCERHGMPGKTDHLPALAAYHGGFDRIPVLDPAYRAYLAGDLDATARLAQALLPGMTDYAWREQRVAAIASVITDTGIMVNKALATQRHAEIAARRVALTERLVTQYGIPTTKADGTQSSNPAATKDGKAAIEAAFLDAGVAAAQLPRTPKGAFATGREGMEELSAAYAGNERVTDLCQVVADMSGLRTVYGTALDTLRGDGACHPGVAFFQASGRWSLTKPGMTVYGKRNGRVAEREIFVPRPGHVFIAADLSQIDARAIAVHSQDPAYMALFEPGTDSHDEVAALVWGEWDRASGHHPRRHDAKAIGHGYNYGMGIPKLAATAGVPERTAAEFDATMKASFPVLTTWKDWIRRVAQTGEPLDNGFGRTLHVDPDRTYTQAPALMGQGTARDLMAETMLRLPDWVARMLRIQVHDEAVYEVPIGQVDEVTAIVHEAMNFEWAPLPGMRPIQVTAEVNKPGVNWMDCYID